MIEPNDPSLRSFVDVAPSSHFPIQNLPFGVFRPRRGGAPRVGVAIGERVLDLSVLERVGMLPVAGEGPPYFSRDSLNQFLAAGWETWQRTRALVSRLLRHDEPTLRDAEGVRTAALLPVADVEMLLPAAIGDYTDFYSSREHATNVGTMFRGPDNALQPNWLHLPVGYHGRSSTVVVSPAPVRRPCGQSFADGAPGPTFGPSRLLDFELETGFLVGPGNAIGEPIPIGHAEEHIFGVVLVNDWSARDIQKWEYVPLGPFLGKSFATSISPWVVTLDALEPFRLPAPPQDPAPLPYLTSSRDAAYDVHLEVHLQPSGAAGSERIAATNMRHLYWSMAQQLAHHTCNGCAVRPGDLMASGTISGPEPGSYGSLLELTWRGGRPLELSAGVRRRFLEDGDTVVMTGWCEGPGYRVGFGEVSGTILPALTP